MFDDATIEPTLPPGSGALAIGGHFAGRYRVIRFLAEGGMGAVYEVEDEELRERVALKLIKPEIAADPRAMERFRREVLLARRVTSPNVCRTFDLGVHERDGRKITFLTMELLPGETLATWIKRRPPSTPDDLRWLVEQLVQALVTAHSAGIIHRDFKAENVILVGRDGEMPRAVVTDFGLARSHKRSPGDNLTAENAMLGSPATMAPEQVTSDDVTFATDLYALGVVLFQLVTGHYPFTGATAMAVAVARLNTSAPRASTLVPTLPVHWDDAIAKCLEQAPSNRFARAEDVLAALYPGGELVSKHAGLELTQSPPGAATVSARPVPPHASRASRRWWVVGAAALAISGAALAYVATRGGSSSPVEIRHATGRPAVLVLDLAGEHGEAWRGCAVSEPLRAALALAPGLRVPGSGESRDVLHDLALAPASSYDGDILRRIAKHTPVDYLVVGSIGARGDVSVSLIDLVSGDAVSSFTGTGEPIAVALAASTEFAAVLGQPRPLDRDAEVRAVLPGSADATKAYCEALQLVGNLKWTAARDALRRVIASEDSFALGHVAMAEVEFSLVGANTSNEAAEWQAARAFAGRLSPRVASRIEAMSLAGEGRGDEAVAKLRDLVKANPDEVWPCLDLASVLGRRNELASARAAIVECRRTLPPPLNVDPRLDLVEAELAVLGADYLAALEIARRGATTAKVSGRASTLGVLTFTESWALLKSGRHRDAIRAAETSEATLRTLGDERTQAEAYAMTMHALIELGQLASARVALTKHHDLLERIGNTEHRVYRAYRDGRLALLEGQPTRAIERCGEAVTTLRTAAPGPLQRLLVDALVCVARAQRRSDIATARANLDEARGIAKRMVPPRLDLVRIADAELALIADRVGDAKSLLENDGWEVTRPLVATLLLGQTAFQSGDLPRAATLASEAEKAARGSEAIDLEIAALALQARIALARGQPDDARRFAESASTRAKATETIASRTEATLAVALAIGRSGDLSDRRRAEALVASLIADKRVDADHIGAREVELARSALIVDATARDAAFSSLEAAAHAVGDQRTARLAREARQSGSSTRSNSK